MAKDTTAATPADRQHQQEAQAELNKIVVSSEENLMAADTVFPLDLFPNTLTVDRTQVTVTHRRFFWMGDVTSIRIDDILNVTANVGPFFGSVSIQSRFFGPDRPYEIRNLWREEALKLKALILGLMIALKENIDTAAIATPELVDKLIALGQNKADAIQ